MSDTESANTSTVNEVTPAIQLTWRQMRDELRSLGYEGPVSYGKPKLAEILEKVRRGETVETPRRGRPAKAADGEAAAPAGEAAPPEGGFPGV